MHSRLLARIAIACCLVVAIWYVAADLLDFTGQHENVVHASPTLRHGTSGTEKIAVEKAPAGTENAPNSNAATGGTTGIPTAIAYDAVPKAVNDPRKDDKIIVIGKLQKEDTGWVESLLPDWQNAIYTVDNTSAALHTPRNKGREANPYLLYLITHYDMLPSTIVFLHPHRDGYPGAWHNDAPGYDNVKAMKTLNIDFVQKNGYANLRCLWDPGCPNAVQYLRDPNDPDPDRRMDHHMEAVWHHFFGNDSVVPQVIATQCCAQFAVSKAQVLKRPREDYIRYHQWLMDTEFDDSLSGRMLEYLWHVIFGQDPVYCPQRTQCYRDVYGRLA